MAVRGLLAITALLAVAGCGAPDAGRFGASVVLVVAIDTLRADRVGCYRRDDAGPTVLAVSGQRSPGEHHAHPDSWLGWARLGQILSRRGDRRGAETAFRRGLEVQPDSLDLHRSLADLLVILGRPDEVIELLEPAGRLAPDDPAAASELRRLRSRVDAAKRDEG